MQYVLSEELAQSLFSYLGARPYAEVAELINAIAQSQFEETKKETN